MRARVLIVDDEADMLDLLMDFLRSKGYEVLTASDGAEALRKVREERPQAILLDVRMPKMDGLQVLREIRKTDKEIGVIMVTAVNEQETGRQAMEMGASDSVVKPLDLQYLERSLWYRIAMMAL